MFKIKTFLFENNAFQAGIFVFPRFYFKGSSDMSEGNKKTAMVTLEYFII